MNILSINPRECDGCGECEIACAEKNTGFPDRAFSRIRVVGMKGRGEIFLPSTCQHCDDPPCMSVCGNSAIYRDDELDRIMIDPDRCIGCKMCLSACPFGAIGFDPIRGFAFKCELCGGDPECVHACKRGAITYIMGNELHFPRIHESADKHYAVLRYQI